MKKTILLLLVSFLAIVIQAQTTQTFKRDSLQLALKKEKTDTGRVILLAELSFTFFESKPDTAMSLALEALSLSRRIDFAKGEAVSLNRIGAAYHVFGNYPKAMEVFLQALKINESIKNTDGIRRNYNNIGNLYIDQDDYRQGLDYYLKAKSLVELQVNQESLSTTYVNIAEAYYFLKDFDSSIHYAQQAKSIASKVGYSRTVGTSFSRLGSIHLELKQNILALEYYRLSIPYSRESQNHIRLSETFLNMARTFDKAGQNDSVVFYGRKSLLLAKEIGLILQVRNTGRFLSAYYRKMRIHDSAYLYQDITKAANDSLFNQQKQKQLQSLDFDEKLRQADIAATELQAKEERNHNLQYAAIAVALITFIILFLVLSRSIIVKQKFIEFFTILGLLAVFEFINLFIHPYLANITNNSPVLMLVVLIAIGALLIPLHHKLQKWITGMMVEKNKKIRLAAAKKTIRSLSDANLEKEI